MSAFWRVIMRIVEQKNIEIVLIDLGPNLGISSPSRD
jgi:hypothetical protein